MKIAYLLQESFIKFYQFAKIKGAVSWDYSGFSIKNLPNIYSRTLLIRRLFLDHQLDEIRWVLNEKTRKNNLLPRHILLPIIYYHGRNWKRPPDLIKLVAISIVQSRPSIAKKLWIVCMQNLKLAFSFRLSLMKKCPWIFKVILFLELSRNLPSIKPRN